VKRLNKTAAVAFLFLSLLGSAEEARSQVPQTAQAASQAKPAKFYRTELYFGRSKPDGTLVSDEDWKRFLAETVTPRFPDGFTVLDGSGQYRDKSGRTVKETSNILIFLYPKKGRRTSHLEIDEIRAAYIKQFNQESVLRVDFSKTVKVTF
jgi:Protein of unknown function (DUF3574)